MNTPTNHFLIAQASDRLRDIGVDLGLIDMELKGCSLEEHLEWILTAPADELRDYRAEMLRGAE